MPQWRKLHTKTVDSLDINDMPDDFTRLLWVLLPLACDRAGRGIDDSAWLKSKLVPLRRDVTLEQIESALAWYVHRGMLERYEVKGRQYFSVPTFAKYQGPTDREAASALPDPEGYEPPEKDNSHRSWLAEMLRHYERKPGVYIIECTATGKVYIGASENVRDRIRAHLGELSEPRMLHPMAKDFRKYGAASIKIRVHRYTNNTQELKEIETAAMALYPEKSRYNRADSRHHWKWIGIEPMRVGHASVMQRSRSDVDVDSDSENTSAAKPPTPVPGIPPAPPAPSADPVKALAAVFEQAAGIKLPTPSGEKSKREIGVLWWAPLREMSKLADGRAPELLLRAVADMRRDGLTIRAPKSVVANFTSLHGMDLTTPPVSPFKDY